MNSNIVRAWKDDFYRQSLSDEERAQLPENPVGELELTDAELGGVFGGQGQNEIHSHVPCPDISFVANGCYTHTQTRECVHPQFSFNFDDCNSYRPGVCHQYTLRYASRECYYPQGHH
jgi:mersacidin/lichenicidin family type 2 lantibiotic